MKKTYGTMYYVDNMKEAVSFYRQVLGAAPTSESDFWTEFTIGNHHLCLHAKRPGETYRENGVLIVNPEGSIKKLYEKMKSDRFDVFGLHNVHGDDWSFHFKDKSGNEVSVYGQA
jgi:catechol 2,3-dioxygenase-like lactoylglutathione lyase family enzyme